MKIEIEGERFALRLDADGRPYILKRFKWNSAHSCQYWGIVWAEWHKGLPTGLRERAVRKAGWVWSRDAANFGWNKVGVQP